MRTPLVKALQEATWITEVLGGLLTLYRHIPCPGQWCNLYPREHDRHGNCPGISKRSSRMMRES